MLVDVREQGEHQAERIDGAHLYPLSTFDPALVLSKFDDGKILVLHCKAGKRSADAASLICQTGRAACRIVSLGGGIEAWKKEGLQVSCSTAGGASTSQKLLIIALLAAAGSLLLWETAPRYVAIAPVIGAAVALRFAAGGCPLASCSCKTPS